MGLPDSSDISDDYGGPYANQRPTEDGSTEMDAEFGNQLMNDVAMMTHTTPRAWVAFTGHTWSGSGTDVVVPSDHDAHWGSSTPVRPTIGQASANRYVITWPATVTDQLGVAKTLNIRYPHEPSTLDSALSRAKVVSKTANTLTIDTFNAAGSANALNGIPVYVSWS